MTEELDGVRKLSVLVPVSKELIADIAALDLFAPDTRTPEQRAADEARRQAARSVELTAVTRRHSQARMNVGVEMRSILDLHAPSYDSWHGPICNGCDVAGYEAEQPEWPCRTWELAAGDV